VAKVTRDRIMVEMDARHPGYEFSRHKGYGTELHLERLNTHGPSPIHRRSFLRFVRRFSPSPREGENAERWLGGYGERLAARHFGGTATKCFTGTSAPHAEAKWISSAATRAAIPLSLWK
jgi:hypothetical protein